jgi:hypothetical protein
MKPVNMVAKGEKEKRGKKEQEEIGNSPQF